MSFSIRERQIEAISRMFRLNSSTNTEEYWMNLWKVLVYDDYCRDIIAPLFPLDSLRKQGITLHLSLNKKREQILDAPAVYFCAPSKENIARICEDCANHLYDSFYLNFSSTITRELLEELASETLKTNSLNLITKVFDQFLNFISLEDNLFILGKPNSYYSFHNQFISDNEAVQNVDTVVDSLLSALATLGKVPIIQCPKKADAAEMIAKRLDEKIRYQLSNPNNLFTDTNYSGQSTTGSSSTSFQRPLLIILDRNIDLSVMLSHSWSYQALIHDLFGMHLNRVQIEKNSKKEVYNLDPTESFLKENAGSPFPTVASTIHQKATEIEAKVGLKKKENGDEEDPFESTKMIHEKINSLPELQAQKDNIAMHTDIARALLDCINERSLHVFFRLEEGIMTKSHTQKKKEILSAIEGDNDLHGLPEDKLRLFIIYYLAHRNLPAAELKEIEEKLTACGCDLSPLQYIKTIETFDNNATATASVPTNSQPSLAKDVFNMFGSMVSAGIQYLVPANKNFYVTRIVDSLMELKQDKLGTGDYIYLDPKFPPNATPRKNTPFREAIVFMVGGGNYLEYQNLIDYVEKSKDISNPGMTSKRIIYGTTEMLTGGQFLNQLSKLGEQLKPKEKS